MSPIGCVLHKYTSCIFFYYACITLFCPVSQGRMVRVFHGLSPGATLTDQERFAVVNNLCPTSPREQFLPVRREPYRNPGISNLEKADTIVDKRIDKER